MERMKQVKNNFENTAHEYDETIIGVIPYYHEMVEALVSAAYSISTNNQWTPNILDLGCGTGNISCRLAEKIPDARFTLVDLSENMLSIAQEKVNQKVNRKISGKDTQTINQDFYHLNLTDDYDIIISSLALHHLENDRDKTDFFKKVFKRLKPGGVFFNADIVLASDNRIQELYMDKWRSFIARTYSEEQIDGRWLANYRNEDRPSKLINQIESLKQIGFSEVDVIWKYYNFAVYGGLKK